MVHVLHLHFYLCSHSHRQKTQEQIRVQASLSTSAALQHTDNTSITKSLLLLLPIDWPTPQRSSHYPPPAMPPTRGHPQLGRPLPKLFIYTSIPIALTLIAHPLLPLFLPQDFLDKFPLPPQPTYPALQANVGFALLAFIGAVLSVPEVGEAFIAKGLKGWDQLKKGSNRNTGPWM